MTANRTHSDENNAKLARFRELTNAKKLASDRYDPTTDKIARMSPTNAIAPSSDPTHAVILSTDSKATNNLEKSSAVNSWPLDGRKESSSTDNATFGRNGNRGVSVDLNEEMEREHIRQSHANEATYKSYSNGLSASNRVVNAAPASTDVASKKNEENTHPNNFATMRQIMKKREEQQQKSKGLGFSQTSESKIDGGSDNGKTFKDATNRMLNQSRTPTESVNSNEELMKVRTPLEEATFLAEAFVRIDRSVEDAESTSLDERDISAWAMTGNYLNETITENGSIVSPSREGTTPSFAYNFTPANLKTVAGQVEHASELLSFLGSPLFDKSSGEENSRFEESMDNENPTNIPERSASEEAAENISSSAEKTKKIEEFLRGRVDAMLSPVPVPAEEKAVTWAFDGWNTPAGLRKELRGKEGQNDDFLMTPSRAENRRNESMEVNVDNTMNESHLISEDEASASEHSNFGSPTSLKEFDHPSPTQDVPASLDESSDCHIEILGMVPRKGSRLNRSSNVNSTCTSAKKRSPTTASLMERNKTLVKEVRFADQTCVELSQKNKFYKSEAGRYKRDLSSANQEISALRTKYEAILHENAKLEALVETFQEQKHQTESQVEALRSQQVRSEEAHRTELKKREETYQSHLRNSENQINCLNERLEQILAANSALQSKFDEWGSKFHEGISAQELILSLKDRIASSDASAAKAESTIQAIQSRMDDLQRLYDRQQDDLQRERNEREMIEHDRDDLQSQCEDLHNQITDFVKKNDTLEYILFSDDGSKNGEVMEELKYTPVKGLSSGNAKNRTPTSNLLARTLRSELKRRHEASDRLAEAEKELGDLQRELSDIKLDLEESKADNALLEDDLEEKCEELEAILNVKNELISSMYTMESKNDALEEELEEKRMHISELEDSLNDQDQKISELETAIDDMRCNHESSDERNRQKMEKLHETIEKLEDHLVVVEKALESTEDELNTAREKLIDTEEKLEKTQGALESTEEELANTQGQLEDTEEKLVDTESKLEKTQGMLKSTEKQLADTQGRLENVEQKLFDTEKKLDKTQGVLESTEEELANTQGQLEDAEEKLADAEEILEKTQGALESTEEELANAQGQMEDLQERFETTSSNLEQTQDDLSKASKKLSEYELRQKELTAEVGMKVQKLERTEEKMQVRLSQSEKQNENLQAQLKSCTRSIAEFEKMLQTLERTDGIAKLELERYSNKISELSHAIQFTQQWFLQHNSGENDTSSLAHSYSTANTGVSEGSSFHEQESGVDPDEMQINADSDSTQISDIIERGLFLANESSPITGSSFNAQTPGSSDSFQRQLCQLRDEVLAANDLISMVKNERDAANQKLHEALRHLQDFRDLIITQESEFEEKESSLQSQLMECEAALNQVIAEKEELTEECERLQRDKEFYEARTTVSPASSTGNLSAEIKSLELRLENETSLLRAARGEARDYCDDVKSAKSAFECLKKEYDSAKDVLATVNQEVHDLRQMIDLKEKELETSKKQTSEMHSERDKLEKKCQSVETYFNSEREETGKVIDDLMMRLSESEQECLSVKAQLNDASNRIKLNEEECRMMREECHDLNDHIKKKEDELRSVQFALVDITTQNAEAQETACKKTEIIMELRGEVHELKSSLVSAKESRVVLEKEIRRLKNNIAQLQCEILEKDENIAVLEKACKDRQKLFEEQLESSRKKRESITNDLEGMIENLKTEGDSAKAIISKKQLQIDSLKEELLKQGNGRNRLEEELIKQKEKIENLQKSLDEETKKSYSTKEELESLEMDFKNLRDRNKATQQELESRELEIERMKTKHMDDESSLDAKIEDLLVERSSLLSRCKYAESLLESRNEERSKLSEKLEQMESNLQGADELKDQQTHNIAELSAMHSKLTKKCIFLREYINYLNNQCKKWEESYKKQSAEVEHYRKQNSRLGRQVNDLKSELLQVRDSSARYKSRMDHIKELTVHSPEGTPFPTMQLLDRPSTL